MSGIKITRLPGDIIVATEELVDSDSACLGIWLDAGSRDESKKTNGLAHLFEHIVFKGTPSRTGLEIVKSLETSGGQINAFTTKERTCFYARVVRSETELALNVLLDMVLNPLLDPNDLKKEKEIIIEELKGYIDNPEEYVYDLFGAALFGDQSIGYPIVGTIGSVRSFKTAHLAEYLKDVKERLPLFVTAVGKLKHKEIVKIVQKIIKEAGISGLSSTKSGPLKRLTCKRTSVKYSAKRTIIQREVQQAHVILGTGGFSIDDTQCFPMLALNVILGDGMSSRLFQRLREDCGCVYNISSFAETLVKAGILGISFNTEPKYFYKSLELISAELAELKKTGITADELQFAKKNLRGTFLLEMEAMHSRMAFIAKVIMRDTNIKSRAQYLGAIDKVTLKDVNKIIGNLFDSRKWAMSCIVPKGLKINKNKLIDF